MRYVVADNNQKETQRSFDAVEILDIVNNNNENR
jgi:hypothetical protein